MSYAEKIEALIAERDTLRAELAAMTRSRNAAMRIVESIEQRMAELHRLRDQWLESRDTLESERAANARLTAEIAASEARAERLGAAGSVILQHYDGFKAKNGYLDDTTEMGALRASLAELDTK